MITRGSKQVGTLLLRRRWLPQYACYWVRMCCFSSLYKLEALFGVRLAIALFWLCVHGMKDVDLNNQSQRD